MVSVDVLHSVVYGRVISVAVEAEDRIRVKLLRGGAPHMYTFDSAEDMHDRIKFLNNHGDTTGGSGGDVFADI